MRPIIESDFHSFMSRNFCRWILPVIQSGIYVLLVWYGCMYRPTWESQFRQWMHPQPPLDGAWNFSWMDGPASIQEQAALGINAPAVLAATLLLIPVDSFLNSGASKELAGHALSLVLIPVMWYLIGTKLGRPVGLSARPSPIVKCITIATAAASLLIAALIAASIVVNVDEMLLGRILMLLWAIAGMIYATKRIRGWGAEAVPDNVPR